MIKRIDIMLKKFIKKSIAIVLIVAFWLTSLPLPVHADTTNEFTENGEEYIYYSDLFYGYSYYLNNLDFFSNHVKAQEAMNSAFNKYLDSPQFTWAAISKHISLTTSMSDLMIAYSDLLGVTNASYNNNLDEANKKFAQALFELKVGDIENISKDTKCIGQFKKIISTLQKVWKAIYDTQNIKTYDTFVDLAYADMQQYCQNLNPILPSLKSGTYTAMSELLSLADDTQEILDIFTALIISLGMEEIRLDVINELIETQEKDTILYEGMNRLYSQLKNGFVGYFIDTYFTEKLIETVSKQAAKYITSSVMKEVAEGIGVSSSKTLISVFGAVTASVGLINTIIFNWILDIPSIENYQVTMILAQYSNLMRHSVEEKQTIFQEQFEVEDIEKYETLMSAYAASMRCALGECASLVSTINNETEALINNLKTNFGDNFYADYISKVRENISNTAYSERVFSNYETWQITTKTILKHGSDKIETSSLYCCGNTFSANIQIVGGIYEGELLVENNSNLRIVGNITEDIVTQKYAIKNAPYIRNNGTLIIDGNVTGSLLVENNGKMDVNGDITFSFGSYSGTHIYGRFIQYSETAQISLSGNYNSYIIYDDYYSDITAGIFCFDGTVQQSVYALKAANIYVKNPNGIKYLSDLQLYGEYLLNGSPLDNNGYATCIYGNLALDDISDYKLVYLLQDQWLSNCNITCNMICNAKLTVPKDGVVTINGTINNAYTVNGEHRENGNGCIIVYGKLTISESIIGNISIINNGFLKVCKDINMFTSSGDYGCLTMSKENSILRIGGNLETRDPNYFQLSNGTLIFDGDEEQIFRSVYARTHTVSSILIENQSAQGVIFYVPIKMISLFNHQGNNFTLYKNSSGSTFEDYDGDGIRDNLDLHPSIHENCVEGHKYSDWKVVNNATPETIGINHKLCTECGDEVIEEIPTIEKLAFKGASLTLQHNLAINYKVDKALFDIVGYTEPYVIFEINGKQTIVKDYVIEGERYVFRFRNIAPNQMNDTINATLYATYNDVGYASETREYSVAQYCYSTLEKYATDEYAELRTLLVDLLHYGAQSQLYTNYNIENLVNANLTETQLLWGTADEPILTNVLDTAYETVENPLIAWKGASLNLNESVSMMFKFVAENIEGLTLKITSETNEWNISSNNFMLENDVYSVKFSGLNAGQMSEKVYLTMYKDDVAVSNTVCYSIESYACSKKDSTIEHLADLVKAMMKYGNSAHSYVN